MKPGMGPGSDNLPKSVRLLDQVRERVRYLHHSLSTEKTYLYWVRFYVRWHGRAGQMRQPREMGAREVEAFLTMLAVERKVSASTHNQALSALLARLLYGTGMRLMEGLRLRIKDVDFDRHVIVVRQARGGTVRPFDRLLPLQMAWNLLLIK
jgi:integrase